MLLGVIILLVLATMPLTMPSTLPSIDQLLTQEDQHELLTPSVPLLTFIDINHVNISWDFNFSAVVPARNVCFVIEYQNNTRYANVSSLICEGNHTFYVFPWLLRGHSYRFRMYATDGIMTTTGNWSFIFTNGVDAPPGPPQSFKSQILSDTEIILTWNNVLLLTNIPAAYEICYNALIPVCVGDKPSIFAVETTSYVLRGLKPATTYYFEIRASLGPFYSVWSDWISVTMESSRKLPTPSTPELTFVNISSVNISWGANLTVVHPARNVCFVIEYQNNTRYANVSSLICTTFYTFPWLLRGQRYRFRVYATDGVITTISDWSFTFINGIDAPPGPPQKLTAHVWSDTEIILTWKFLDLIASVAYEICYNALSPVCVDKSKVVIGDTYHRLLALKPATTYYFEIRASLAPFYSVWSDWINATTENSSDVINPTSTVITTTIHQPSVTVSSVGTVSGPSSTGSPAGCNSTAMTSTPAFVLVILAAVLSILQ